MNKKRENDYVIDELASLFWFYIFKTSKTTQENDIAETVCQPSI